MNFWEWKKANAGYGRRLLHSGLEGARSGGENFLEGKPLVPFVEESARHALAAAAVGAGIGLIRGVSSNRDHRTDRAFAYGVIGAVLGFGAGLVWESRCFGSSVVSGALKNIGKVRDEHWLEMNPIDYA